MIQDPIQVFFLTQMYLIYVTSQCLDPVICKIPFRRKVHNEASQAAPTARPRMWCRRAETCCSVGVVSVKFDATVETKFTLSGFKR